MKIMIAAVFYFLYWGVCFLGTGTDRKNLIGLRSYPDEVQTRVRSDPQLGKTVPKEKSTAAILLSNLLLFTVVFSVLGLEVMNIYDGVVIDKLWVGHSQFWVLPGLEDAPFVQTWRQVLKKRSILALIWVAGAAIVGGIVHLIF